MNIVKRTLRLLNELDSPTRKQTLANKLDTTENYVAQALAKLNKGRYIIEEKGWYRISWRGKAILEQDPELLDFMVETGKSSQLKINLPFRQIAENSQCKDILARKDELKKLSFLSQELLPTLLLWLITSGYKVPDIKPVPDHRPGKERRTDILEQYLNGIASTLQGDEDEDS